LREHNNTLKAILLTLNRRANSDPDLSNVIVTPFARSVKEKDYRRSLFAGPTLWYKHAKVIFAGTDFKGSVLKRFPVLTRVIGQGHQ
jgi:hypothetical protein